MYIGVDGKMIFEGRNSDLAMVLTEKICSKGFSEEYNLEAFTPWNKQKCQN